MIKVPVRAGAGWALRSRHPSAPDRPLNADTRVRVVARVLGPVALA